MRRVLGIDLDNTLIDYAPAYAAIADEIGLSDSLRDRQSIRGALRTADGRDEEWQRFQAKLYTSGLEQAVPAEGALDFLDHAIDLGWRIYIVSHKTKRTPDRFGGSPLRERARRWLIDHLIIPGRCRHTGLFFEDTQEQKLNRIRDLGCEVFIDDLDSVVFHASRPLATQMVQYVPGEDWNTCLRPGVAGYGDFPAIAGWLRQC